MSNSIDPQKVQEYVSTFAPRLGDDWTKPPVFPKGITDCCVVMHKCENGHTGYDTLYAVWKNSEGNFTHTFVVDTSSTGDYLFIDELTVEERELKIKYGARTFGKKERTIKMH